MMHRLCTFLSKLAIFLILVSANFANALSAPSNVQAPPSSVTGSFEVEWSSVAGATHIAVFESIDFQPYTLVQFTGATKFNAVGRGVGRHIYVMAACNASGCSGFTNPVIVDVEAPVVSNGATPGTFSLQWNQEETDVSYPVYMSYNWGPYSLVEFDGNTIFRTEGKPNGVYLFTVGACTSVSCDPSTSPVTQVVVSGNQNPQPDSRFEQAFDQYQARTGDINGDGLVDLYIERLTPSIQVDGTVQSTILMQNTNGNFNPLVPSASQTNIAKNFPISESIEIGRGDLNADGFLDISLSNLDSDLGTGMGTHMLFAPGVIGNSAPLGVTRITPSLARLMVDIAGALIDPAYVGNNFSVTGRPVIGFEFSPSIGNDGFGPGFLSIKIVGFTLDVDLSIDSTAIAVSSLLRNLRINGTYSEQDVSVLSGILQARFGVPFFGFNGPGGSYSGSNNFAEVIEVPSSPSPPLSEAEIDALERAASVARWELSWIPIVVIDGPEPPPFGLDARQHFFETVSEICNINGDPNCTLDNVFCRVLQYPAPGRQENGATARNGQTSVLDAGDGFDPIEHVIPPNQSGSIRVLRNVTLPRHIFHNPNDPDGGITERRVEMLSDGRIVVRTIGSGSGRFASVNESVGPGLFRNLDDTIEALYDTMPMCMDTPASP